MMLLKDVGHSYFNMSIYIYIEHIVVVFRSQFAMNFLDPSFIPLTNALNEELQGKSSKWKFNKTAFSQQRQALFSSLLFYTVTVGKVQGFYCEKTHHTKTSEDRRDISSVFTTMKANKK